MRKVTKCWTTRDGSKVRICDMTDGHLLNTMRMLSRFARRDFEDAIAVGFGVLGTLRGEMAQWCMEGEIAALEEVGPGALLPEIYSSLEDEAERRGLPLEDDPSILEKVAEG